MLINIVNLRTSLGSQSNHLPKVSPCYSLISVGESLLELLHTRLHQKQSCLHWPFFSADAFQDVVLPAKDQIAISSLIVYNSCSTEGVGWGGSSSLRVHFKLNQELSLAIHMMHNFA